MEENPEVNIQLKGRTGRKKPEEKKYKKISSKGIRFQNKRSSD